ncbi:MAG: HEAT repeat domain-containing protein [Verrucomicrobia bacterium]|nr:HEAT repeat domain-containing protein [Verrucomicrobiota bacterium]
MLRLWLALASSGSALIGLLHAAPVHKPAAVELGHVEILALLGWVHGQGKTHEDSSPLHSPLLPSQGREGETQADAPSSVSFLISTEGAHTPDPHHIPDGFVIEKVAGDPAILFPMFATFDDRGRLFVAESSGLDLYAELRAQTRKCRISLLEDRDGDGRFETARVFADRLVFPMGLVWREGRLYVADPPDLVSFADRNNDGVADERKVVVTGFGHTDNGSLHGLTFGPDGLLYMTMGEPDGYRLTRRDGSVLTGRSGALIRCRADGADPEVLCRGFENLVEIVFLPNGAIIGTDNWYQKPDGGMRDALVHLVDGGLYPMQPDQGTHYPLTGDPLPPTALYPAVALSGLALYRSDAFPAEMRDNLFSAQHNSRKVARHVLILDQETFRVEDHDFITSDDPDFHPADVLEDADGSLLVVDTGGWYVQHCPTGRIRNSRAPGGIYRVRSKTALRIDDPWGLKISWNALRAEQLATLLEDQRWAVRDRAQLALSMRRSESVPALTAVLARAADFQEPTPSPLPGGELATGEKTATPLLGGDGGGFSVPMRDRRIAEATQAKLHALWALAAIPDSAALLPLRQALTNREPDLVCVAAQALGLRVDRESAPTLRRLLESTSPSVRLAAAQALARCGTKEALPAIWSALGEPEVGRFLEHALIHAAYQIADEPGLTRALHDAHPRVQKAALLLLDQPPRSHLPADAVIARLSATDSDLRKTALQILQKHSEWTSHASEVTQTLLLKPGLSGEEPAVLRNLILAFQNDATVQRQVAEALTRFASSQSEDRAGFLWETLAQVNLRSPPPAWIKALQAGLTGHSTKTRLQAVKIAALWQVPTFDPQLLNLMDDASAGPELRMEALRAVLPRHARLSQGTFDLLLGEIGSQSNPVSRLVAAGLLGRSELTDAQIKALLEAIRRTPILSTSLLAPALARAGESVYPVVLAYFSEAVRAGWRPSDEEMTRLARNAPKSMQEESSRWVAEIKRLKENESNRLIGLEPLLKGGEAGRGRQIFFGNKVVCSACHRVGNEGGAIGPDLTKIGAVRSGRDLLESIVVPSSTFAQGYESYSATLKDGREIDGILVQQTANAVRLRDASGADHLIHKQDVQELKRRATSLMPDGLDSALSPDEFRDLLTFLQGLK